MTEQSSGNVFADLEMPYPNARMGLARMKRLWNATAEEEIPDRFKQLLNDLD